MKQYLRKRKGGGAYYYQRRVPKALRHRFPNVTFIEEYLGTSDRKVAERKVSAVNERWEQRFAVMHKDDLITASAVDQIRLAEQWQAYNKLAADPLSEPDKLMQEMRDFGPELESGAREVLGKLGLDVTPRNIAMAQNAIWEGRFGASVLYEQGITPPKPSPYGLPVVESSSPGGPTLIEAAEAYQTAKDVSTKEKTRKQLSQTARLFADHVGKHKPIAAITGRDAVGFLDKLASINPDYRHDPKSGELTLAQLEEFYPARDGKGLSAATLNRHAMNMRVLINWLIDRHELPEEHRNPFEKKSRKVVTQTADSGNGGSYLPMSNDEIAKLLKGATLAKRFGRNFKECIGWLVALGAYTGGRADELCSLIKDDVRERNGIPYLAIRGTKTENAPRVVPIHSDLIKAGFLDYVETCQGPLFGVTGKTLSKRFPAYRRKLGVDAPGKVFHSLRKSFVSCLEEADVPSDTVALLEGHKAKRSFTFAVYNPHGPTLKKLAAAVAKVKYKGVKLSGAEAS